MMNSLASPHWTSKFPGDTSMPLFLALSMQYSTASFSTVIESEYNSEKWHCKEACMLDQEKVAERNSHTPGLRSLATIRQPFLLAARINCAPQPQKASAII